MPVRPDRALAFMACPPEDFALSVARLHAERPDTDWDLVCFYDPPWTPSRDADPPSRGRTRIIRSRRTLAFASSFWWATLRRSYRAVYLVAGRLETAEPFLMAFVSLFPCATKLVIDRQQQRRPITLRSPIRTALSLAATPFLLWLARLVTLIGLGLFRAPRRVTPRGSRLAFLVPILPDISHTFVYREVLALLDHRPDAAVVVLEPGDPSVVHREAAELMTRAVFAPRLPANRYLLVYLKHWLRRPAAMADLIRFFAPHTATFGPGAIPDDPLCFLRVECLHHANHLMAGLMLADHLDRHRIAYLHVYGSTYPAVAALVAHRLLGIPFSLSTFVDFDYVTPFHMLDAKFGLARFVVVCTEFCARRLGQRFPDLAPRFRVLRHALNADYAEGKALRPQDGCSRLVYIGRFVPKKGLDTLVRACAQLRARGMPFTCHLYGKGEVHEDLQSLIHGLDLSGSVFLEPPVANEHIYDLMNHDDVFVCPSRYMPDGERDGIPVTLLEAMAAGVTVVSTPVSGIPELVEDGRNGYLVPPDDPAALAGTLESLLRSADERRRVSASARQTVRERFSLEEAVATLDEWLSRESRSGASAR